MVNNQMNDTLLKTSLAAHQAPTLMKKRLIRAGIWIFLLMLSLAFFSVNWGIDNKQRELEEALHKRLEIIAQGRADILSQWFSGLIEQAERISEADLFRLYAAEVNLLDNNLSQLLSTTEETGNEQISQQLPLMENILREFQESSIFESARVINRGGYSYISTDSKTKTLQPEQRQLAELAIIQNHSQFSAAKMTEGGLTLTFCVPIRPPQTDNQAVSALMLNVNVSNKITEILSPSPLSAKGERTRLLQLGGEGYQELVPWLTDSSRSGIAPLAVSQQFSFGKRTAPGTQTEVYSLAVKIPNLDWWILQEANAKTSMAPLVKYRQVAISMVILLGLLFFVLTGALWWRLVGTENQKIAAEFKELAKQIEKQRQLLDSINGNLHELIGLKDNSGAYIYVNPAFAKAAGRQPEELYGLDDSAIFGFDTAKRLAPSDRKVIETRSQITINENIYLQSRHYHFQISKVPFIDHEGKIAGIISSLRDVTAIIEQQNKAAAATRQTIEALAKTIELHDPYLAGHSRLMSTLSVAVAKQLGLSDQIKNTVEIASYLSQIGKVYVPAALLQKTEALTLEEKSEIEKHVEHSIRILKDIAFDLPILESLKQMNENLDGSGYPAGLKGDQIGLQARILAVTNSYAAMLRPRAYRPARDSEEIFEIYAETEDKYDTAIVTALHEVMKSPLGSKIMAGNY